MSTEGVVGLKKSGNGRGRMDSGSAAFSELLHALQAVVCVR
jgi:hypothetical protein